MTQDEQIQDRLQRIVNALMSREAKIDGLRAASDLARILGYRLEPSLTSKEAL
ncbi:hypothetical protein J8F10_24200 [Gemmata sp. G18]|uniref:Uncharacterized protein n=1 Tax=Gemmata palustris TaxID=2822762 RepID=A0ABS5BZN8_9BACT|nr:hypothetical protein [Gemmata palustris]MBP3958363.1 hypothetical protein [Gemmata palustris]